MIAAEQQVDHPYTANEQYGAAQAPITHATGDPAADLLYTMNFAISGMHEAAMATGDPEYARVIDGMAGFFVRAQTHSETHPELQKWMRHKTPSTTMNYYHDKDAETLGRKAWRED